MIELEPGLSVLVDALISANEEIWSTEFRGETACVRLIERDKIAQSQAMELIGLAGGAGRCLHFMREGITYRFLGESKWIG